MRAPVQQHPLTAAARIGILNLPALVPALMLALAPRSAAADVPFILVLAWAPQIAWWTVPIALAVELLALRWAFALGWTEALAADVLMNLVSSAGGLLLVGVPAIWFETVLRPAATHAPLAGGAILCGDMALLALGDVAIEALVLWWYLRPRFTAGRLAALFLANLISVAVAFAGLAAVHALGGRY